MEYKLGRSIFTNKFSKLIQWLFKYCIFISKIIQIDFISEILQINSVKTNFYNFVAINSWTLVRTQEIM